MPGGLVRNADGRLRRARVFAGKSGQQLALPVAGNAGDADDFARMHVQRDVLQINAKGRCGGQRQAAHLQHGLANGVRALLQCGRLGANHHAAQ